MSSHLKDKHEKILQILAELADESRKGTIIVTEGKKDEKALRDFDVEGLIITAKTGGRSLSEVATEIEKKQPKEVILLFDFDNEGKDLTSYFKTELERSKIRPNFTIWQDLLHLLGREVQCIESLTSYMKTLERKTA